jgi:LmbE family N-acetylglucosaminyl deacetylase
VASWVALAVGASPEPPALFVTGSARSIPGDVVDRLAELGAYEPGYPDRTSPTDDDVVARLHGRVLERKLAALARHASQTEPLREAFGDAAYARFASYEAYRPANEVARTQMGTRHVTRWAS